MTIGDLREMHVAAESYVVERGWPIIPIPPIDGKPTKAPIETGWPDHLLEAGTAKSELGENSNIGLLLRDLADIDLDCREAREAAKTFLPETGLTYGRASSPASHRLYSVSGALSYKQFKLPSDEERGDLLEIRAMTPTNGSKPKAFQSVLPPSVHPSGEQYNWDRYEDATVVNADLLRQAAHLVAITAAIARLYPELDDAHKAARDEFRLAVSGVLARRLPDVGLKIFTTALRIAGDRKDRSSIFKTTVDKVRRNANVKGIPALAQIVGQRDAGAIATWIDAVADQGEPATDIPAIEESLLIESFVHMEVRPVEWLWPQRLPKNKLVIFGGNPDVGKTTATADVIARYTTARDYPDVKNLEPPGEVLLLIAEDDLSDTVKPRLLAAGADISKIHYARAVQIRKGAKKTERMLALDSDLDLLERLLKENPHIGLVVFDPITGYFGKADINKEQELRRVLGPIKELAERVRVTVIGLGHFNKRSDVSALHRIGGAVAMSGVARAVWLFVKDPDEPGLYKMLLGKGNLTKKRGGMKYRIVEKIIPVAGGVPTIAWEGETSDDADDALVVDRDPEAKKTAKAKRFLLDYFAEHPIAQPSADVIEIAEANHISKSTCFRARKALQIRAYKQAGIWFWEPQGTPEP